MLANLQIIPWGDGVPVFCKLQTGLCADKPCSVALVSALWIVAYLPFLIPPKASSTSHAERTGRELVKKWTLKEWGNLTQYPSFHQLRPLPPSPFPLPPPPTPTPPKKKQFIFIT
jgi:hypothetical protein